MKVLLIFIISIRIIYGITYWQYALDTLLKYFGASFESQIEVVINGPYPSIPDPKFPGLKMYIFTRENFNETYLRLYRIDLENLYRYTTEFNKFTTILYIYGYLDKPTLLNPDGRYERTTASIITGSYMLRYYWAEYYLKKTQVPPLSYYTNILIVDWSDYNTDYLPSLLKLPAIADVIGDKLYALSQDPTNPLDLSKWHLIGHSLGAHMAGMIARRIKQRAGKVIIPRVTGLDPAGPIIEFAGFREFYPRLDKDCAHFVDVIHTDAGVYGSDRKMGHVDFWPNGGSNQPGCPKTAFFDIILRQAICSHLRAVELYAESVVVDTLSKYPQISNHSEPAFDAVLCSRFAEFNFFIDKVKIGKLYCKENPSMKTQMGLPASADIPSGNYYLVTDSSYYYSQGVNGTRPYLSGNALAQEFNFQ